MLHITGFLNLCSSRNLPSGRNNNGRNGQLEGYSARQCVFENLQRCANSRWLTHGSDHTTNYDITSRCGQTILCYFLAAIPSLNIHVYLTYFKHGFSCKVNKCSDAGTWDIGLLPTHKTSLSKMATLRRTHQAMASLGSDAPVPRGSVEEGLTQQPEPLWS